VLFYIPPEDIKPFADIEAYASVYMLWVDEVVVRRLDGCGHLGISPWLLYCNNMMFVRVHCLVKGVHDQVSAFVDIVLYDVDCSVVSTHPKQCPSQRLLRCLCCLGVALLSSPELLFVQTISRSGSEGYQSVPPVVFRDLLSSVALLQR